MKKMKKFLAMLLSVVMVLGMSVTVFAEKPDDTKYNTMTLSAGQQPSDNDKVKVTISGIKKEKDTDNEERVSITLYKIAKAKYDTTQGRAGIIGYEWSNGTESLNTKEPTASNITTVANGLKNKKITAWQEISSAETDFDFTKGEFSKEVKAGAYIAIITGSTNGYVYNPVFLTATYNATTDNNGNVTEVNLLGGTINVGTANYMYGTTSVAKRTEPTITKEITNGATSETIENDVTPKPVDTFTEDGKTKIHTASIGDVLEYTIKPELPSYPADAVNKTFFISDSMEKGLTLDYGSLSISLGDNVKVETKYRNKEVEYKGTKSTIRVRQYYIKGYENEVFAESFKTTTDGKDGFNINFTYENLISDKTSGATYKPVIKYNAVVNDQAVVGSVGNKNDVAMIYSKTPNTGKDWEDPSHTPENDPVTGTDYGRKEDKEIVYTYQLAFKKTDDAKTPDTPKALAGAVFGIYKTGDVEKKTVDATTLVDTVTTNENGFAVSSQVENGEYYIKEITAPTGYSLNDKVFKVTASWTSATTTSTSTKIVKNYTSTANDKGQVGWLVGTGEGTFAKIGEYEERDGKIYKIGEENEAENVRKAYLVSTQTTTESTTATITPGTAAGSGSVYITDGTITDTKLTALPSTGGIGTTIFTIGGCAIMILAAGLYFMSRRKSAK